jgi:hypothetical protein
MNRVTQSLSNRLVATAAAVGAFVRRHVVDEQPWEWDPIFGDWSPDVRVLSMAVPPASGLGEGVSDAGMHRFRVEAA